MEIDRNGHVIKITLLDGSSIRYEYDDADNLISVTDANGAKTRYVYDDDKGNPLLAGNTNDRISLSLEDAIKGATSVQIVRSGL